MSFRLRVLAMVALVVVTATSVTAWLTFRQASQQVTESADAQREDIDTITQSLAEYGRTHGTWEGVASLVEQLGYQTGQRIQVTTELGQVLVDTDTLAGRTARPVDSPALQVNPRPTLDLPTDVAPDLPPDAVAVGPDGEVLEGDVLEGDVLEEEILARPGAYSLSRITADEIRTYRSGVLLAACLTRRGARVSIAEGPYGVPHYSPVPGSVAAADCGWPDPYEEAQLRQEALLVAEACMATGVPDPQDQQAWGNCLSQVFARRIDDVAPVPLNVYLGAANEDTAAPLSSGPVLAAAGVVATLAVAGSLVISRRVLRPIRALTGASHRLGQGDLSERVPVLGRDELAGLAQSFNRMADSLQRGEERQRRLVADVAHELRTPLANVRGYLEALKDGVVAPDPELFTSLYEEAVLQQRIVDDLQDLALAEAGSLVYHRSRVDLGELLETCCAAHQAVAEAAEVRVSAATTGPVYLHADPDRLRQMLGNLVGNALRATPAGGTVTLTGWREGHWAVVTVADTGTGIAREHLPYVFDRFWRADAARGRATGGSGLGLAIARQIVTDHSGTIEVASRPEVGTTFTIRLPAAQ